ncbi:MAG: SMC-Scp complex subunit ScpB [Cytophagales bacterium]|nr:SMC-Scp complex subunit ScpB [Cytophagales bacterium]MDW8383411.1 SMC-Scp complex subunit ScpB [Flammeovirgaceae bacterium]
MRRAFALFAMNLLTRHIEALIFTSETPISLEQIANCLKDIYCQNFDIQEIEQAIHQLVQKYQSEEFSFEILHIANGYLFMTKPAYQNTISTWLKQNANKRLSKPVLETLAIIAYKQPVSKTEIELIRGVNSDYAIKKLLDIELIEIKGKSQNIGRPLLYGTTQHFLTYFGINSIDELPALKEISPSHSEIGQDFYKSE